LKVLTELANIGTRPCPRISV